ncbi:tRNA (cytidine(34)-2'-O)-methyltransferase [Methylolobus aquaticus]|nr:tRNA (cytidine(34)-2'-O)-methyltransferase [Methylolobus aquaticus]
MFHIVLVEPEIPPNAGNIIRLTANLGAHLHLIHPLGFELSDKQLRRAGMDYRDLARVSEHASWMGFVEAVRPQRTFAITTKGERCYAEVQFRAGDGLVFGPESRGLSRSLLDTFDAGSRLSVPMAAGSRSMNLSNCVAVVAYEAWRQCGFVSDPVVTGTAG